LTIVIFRIGSQIPAPGVNVSNVHECVKGATGGAYNLINLFSGGALLQADDLRAGDRALHQSSGKRDPLRPPSSMRHVR
jgi:hypothetical protein